MNDLKAKLISELEKIERWIVDVEYGQEPYCRSAYFYIIGELNMLRELGLDILEEDTQREINNLMLKLIRMADGREEAQ